MRASWSSDDPLGLELLDALPTRPVLNQKIADHSLPHNSTSRRKPGGEEEDRTPDLRIANAALSQLSYPPNRTYFSDAAAVPVGHRAERAKRQGFAPDSGASAMFNC
jgi:hypothetical protein